MAVETTLQGMIDTLSASLADAKKHDAGQSAASARVRAALQNVRTGCADLRKTIQEEKNARKTTKA